MNEVGFYEEVSKKFQEYLSHYFGSGYEIRYATNNTLDNLVTSLEKHCNCKIVPGDIYVPKLKVDIVFSIWDKLSPPKLLLIEVKYLSQLSLKEYSQLVGYLQVAKVIDIGLLLLIQKEGAMNKLSGDFLEILRLRKLPMDWIIILKELKEEYEFRTGIISYVPQNGIDWIDTKDVNGISSFEQLVSKVKGS